MTNRGTKWVRALVYARGYRRGAFAGGNSGFASKTGSAVTMKYQIVHFLQKYYLNPPIKILFAIGIAPPGYALLETVGRTTGKPRRTPVGDGRVGYQFWIIAEHGMKAGYIRNITKNPRVRIKLRHGIVARWHTGRAEVLAEDDARERQKWLGRRLPSSAVNAAVVRLMGTQLVTVGIDLDEELL